jgi:hypothetical protein
MLGQSKSQTAEAADPGTELMAPKEPPVGVRFTAEVKAALEKLAKTDDRTISYVINKIVTDYLRARKLIK